MRPEAGALLPHGYPFRLVERAGDGAVLLQVSGNAALLRGAESLPAFLVVEMMAQAALMILPRDEEAGELVQRGVLAGVESLRCDVALFPGDRLHARPTLLGRLGGVVKARVELVREEQVVAAGDLLLALS